MAPELARKGGDKNYTDKIDLYAIGLIMFELVTGMNPDKAGCYEWAEGIDNEKVRKVLVQADVSMKVIKFILKCIEKDPKDRYGWE